MVRVKKVPSHARKNDLESINSERTEMTSLIIVISKVFLNWLLVAGVLLVPCKWAEIYVDIIIFLTVLLWFGSCALKKIITLFFFIGLINTTFYSGSLVVNWLAVFVCIPVLGIAMLVMRRYIPAFLFTAAFVFWLYYLNELVKACRGTYIQFSDLYCIREALRVAHRYTPIFNMDIAWCLVRIGIIVVVYVYIVKKFFKHERKGVFWATWSVLTWGVILLLLSPSVRENAESEKVNFFVNGFTDYYGLPVALYKECCQSFLKMPEEYSKEEAYMFLEKFEDDTKQMNEKVNVVVIMNESFADFSLYGDTKYKKDPLQHFHSLNGNCIKGEMVVSVYGGGTANTEFEFLTGASMTFMPLQAVPYMTYISKNTYSVAHDFAALGYSTTAIHPYLSQEYRRETNYPIMGFKNTIFGQNFSSQERKDDFAFDVSSMQSVDFGNDLEYVRGLVSDAECYRKVMQILKADNLKGEVSFVFLTTIQNHGGYGYSADDFVTEEYIGNDAQADQYLTLLHLSDTAFEEFIEELKNYKEKTVVLMFGDHQPGMEINSFLKNDSEIMLSEEERYTVPYVMWSNFDTEWVQIDKISPNYLSAVLKNSIGAPLNAWDQFRLMVMEKYPVLSVYNVEMSDGKNVSVDTIQQDEIMREYEKLQYYLLFDYGS